jgi:hypothetical protein
MIIMANPLPRFVKPSELYGKEEHDSLYRILSETTSETLARTVASYRGKVSIMSPVVATEVYRIFENDEKKAQKVFDFALSKAYSFTLFDWVVDGDIKTNIEKTHIAAKWLDEMGSRKLGELSKDALTFYSKMAGLYLDSAMDELALEPNEKNYFSRMGKTASVYEGMFGAAAIVGGAKGKELDHVSSFGQSFCRASKLLDDISDMGQKEKWNIADILGKEAVDGLQKKEKEECKSHLRKLRNSPNRDYLLGIVDFLYQ